jgi:anti-sigma factor RsiW
MTSDSVHPEDEIQELLDGRLRPERRAEVEQHLAGCAECRRFQEALAYARETVRTGLLAARVPGEVVAGVAAAIDREARRATAPESPAAATRPGRGRRVVLVASLAAALALAVILLRPRTDSLPAAAARDFQRVRSGVIALALQTESPGAMEAFFVRKGVPFRTRVFDFGMMGYRLAGGSVHTLAGRPSALFAYRDPRGRLLVCQMYEGRTSELPRTAETRRNADITFSVYRRGKQTVVFWQEGSVTCVLASDIDPEEVIQLAFAKAMKAS